MRFLFVLISVFHFTPLRFSAQVGNMIANGSFEEHYPCPLFGFYSTLARNWMGIDSTCYAGNYRSTCNLSVPLNGNGYQYPKSGTAYVICGFFCPSCGRGYLKNILKRPLQQGKNYCVKFYINITNTSPRGMDGFGVYFGDGEIDTIKTCYSSLTYLTPHVKNPLGNVISDTLNWVPITGTFVANGTEKYALIGNFLGDNAVTTASINTPSYPQYWTDVNIDDVSCIELNLPAYAGPDQSLIPGDSVFIGREPDFAIDPGCVWYQLPNATPIATISGLWVKPLVTTTYVVRQELDCSPLKYDTVVVYPNPVGIREAVHNLQGFEVYPVPADDRIEIRVKDAALYKSYTSLNICNSLGQMLRNDEIVFKENLLIINISDLPEGIYQLQLHSVTTGTASKRLVVAR